MLETPSPTVWTLIPSRAAARALPEHPMSLPSRPQRVLALARLELTDSLRSRWLQFAALVYALVFGAFIWLGLRESSVLGFTGLSRVVLNVANATVVAIPLVALVATCQAIAKARTSGHLELIFTLPTQRGDWFLGLVFARLTVLLGPLVALLLSTLLVGAFGLPDPSLLPMVVHALLVSTSLVIAYVGLGLLVSAVAQTLERAVVLALVVWLASIALHDFALIGVLLQWRVPAPIVFALAALNPVEAARLAILSSVDPELAVLGPVGFWIANQLGPQLAYFLGLAWPATVGLVTLAISARLVRTGDAVR